MSFIIVKNSWTTNETIDIQIANSLLQINITANHGFLEGSNWLTNLFLLVHMYILYLFFDVIEETTSKAIKERVKIVFFVLTSCKEKWWAKAKGRCSNGNLCTHKKKQNTINTQNFNTCHNHKLESCNRKKGPCANLSWRSCVNHHEKIKWSINFKFNLNTRYEWNFLMLPTSIINGKKISITFFCSLG